MAEALERSTAWQRTAAVVYGITILAIRVFGAVLNSYARREHLRAPGPDDPGAREIQRKYIVTVVAYLLTIAIALVAPIVAIIFYFMIAVFIIVPFQAIGRELFRRPRR